MAYLNGHSQGVAYMAAPMQAGAYAEGATAGPTTTMSTVIDGTPVRVVVLALSAAAGLVALHWAGFRFSLGVSA